jgi:DNA-binding MarR family transcriptional regulator
MSSIMPESVDNVKQEDDVLDLVHAVMHQVRSHQHQELRSAAELTPMEARVLRFFGRNAGATQSELAEHSGRDKAQLARLVKGLRERGLLVEQQDAGDRRQVRLALSAEGEALRRRLKQLDRRLTARAVHGLAPAEQAQLRVLLRRVQDNLRD